MIHKEVLAKFLFKNLANQPKSCLPSKRLYPNEIAMYIEQRGWVKAKIFLTNYKYIEKYRFVGIIYKCTKFGF